MKYPDKNNIFKWEKEVLPYKTKLEKELLEPPDWFKNPLHQILDEPKESDCTPNDCMCGPYEHPYDNYFYKHKLNPAYQYMFWIQEWKKSHWEIHKGCQELGQTTYSDEYVRGFMDAVSPIFPTGDINNITEEEIMDFMTNDVFNEISLEFEAEWDRKLCNN